MKGESKKEEGIWTYKPILFSLFKFSINIPFFCRANQFDMKS